MSADDAWGATISREDLRRLGHDGCSCPTGSPPCSWCTSAEPCDLCGGPVEDPDAEPGSECEKCAEASAKDRPGLAIRSLEQKLASAHAEIRELRGSISYLKRSAHEAEQGRISAISAAKEDR